MHSTTDPRWPARVDLTGLLALSVLSLLAAAIPWLASADAAISAALSLIALGFPVAALRGGDSDDEDEETGIGAARPAPQEVVIIGAGFSGTMLAVQLAKAGGPNVTLIERRELPARGVAYSTAHPNHLLNVRAAKMSAFPDDPDHFVRWLRERGLGGPFDFAPRRSYGAYLDELLAGARAVAGRRLSLVEGNAVDIGCEASRSVVSLDDGRRIPADRVVLALGNQPPRDLPGVDAGALPTTIYAANPWDAAADAIPGPEDTVLLLGTGLTMIDSVIALTDAGFEGRIVATSRRGLMPHVHADGLPPAHHHRPPPGLAMSRLLRTVRDRADRIGWRAAIDELRPIIPALWRGATRGERARFLRHLRPWWDIHRHRIAPAIAERIQGLAATGRLELLAGTVTRIESNGAGARVSLRLRGTSYVVPLDVARIVNCMGPNGDIRAARDPLLDNLLAKGSIRPDPHRLGIDVTESGAAIGRDGEPSPGLHAIGPLARGRSWEATAVPELRVQAAALAALICAERTALQVVAQ